MAEHKSNSRVNQQFTAFSSGLKWVFAGTPEFSAVILESLLGAGFKPEAVYCQPDRRVGRGKKVQYGAVKKLALEQNLPLEQPLKFDQSLDDEGFTAAQKMASYQPDLMIVVAYGLILPVDILTLPTFGCVNIHASLLPRWRGAAPIQRAIEAGDQETGITIMQMDKGLDTGNMLLKRACEIHPQDTAADLHDRLAALGSEAIIDFLSDFSNTHGSAYYPGEIQAKDEVSYAHKLEKAEAEIDWQQDAEQIHNRIRAFNPWPVCFTHVGKERLRIWAAQLEPLADNSLPAGQVVKVDKQGLLVACGDGNGLLITRLQADGSRQMSVAEFLNAKSHWFDPMPRLGRQSSD